MNGLVARQMEQQSVVVVEFYGNLLVGKRFSFRLQGGIEMPQGLPGRGLTGMALHPVQDQPAGLWEDKNHPRPGERGVKGGWGLGVKGMEYSPGAGQGPLSKLLALIRNGLIGSLDKSLWLMGERLLADRVMAERRADQVTGWGGVINRFPAINQAWVSLFVEQQRMGIAVLMGGSPWSKVEEQLGVGLIVDCIPRIRENIPSGLGCCRDRVCRAFFR